VQNVRAFGSESMLEGVQAVVNQRMSEMATKMDATLEHLRIGAIKGQILDADGSAVIYDLFTEFGVMQHTEMDFDLDNASPAPGAVKKKCDDIRRKVEDELGTQPYEHVHAICGADFFDDLITHSEVAKAYDRYLDGAFLRQGQARGSFEYSSIVSRSIAAGSVRSTSPTRARRTSSRSACRGCSGGTTRPPTSSRPPTPSACRAMPSRLSTSSSRGGSCCTCSRTRCRSARGRAC
jgi:Phage major capsid protein E